LPDIVEADEIFWLFFELDWMNVLPVAKLLILFHSAVKRMRAPSTDEMLDNFLF